MAVPTDLTSREPDKHRSLAIGRFWAGGVATPVIAALVVVADSAGSWRWLTSSRWLRPSRSLPACPAMSSPP